MSTQMDDQARQRGPQETPAPVEERSFADNVRLAAGALLTLALVLFFAFNFERTDIDFLLFDVEMPLVFALVASAAFGGLATWLFTTLRGRSERKRQEAMFDSAMRGAKKDR
jgi:uncharacterized integral membrane protein